MGQSLCKGQKDAVLDQPQSRSPRSAGESFNNTGDSGVVDDQLDISRLPVLLSLDKDIAREPSNVGTKLQNRSSAPDSDAPNKRNQNTSPSPERKLQNGATSVAPSIEPPNKASSPNDESITPDEVAELDKSNYPIKLGDDISSAPDIPSKRDDVSSPLHKSPNKTPSVPAIEPNKISPRKDESITPEEVAELDKSNYPIKLGDDMISSENRSQTASATASSKVSNGGPTCVGDLQEVGKESDEVKDLEASQNPLSTSTNSKMVTAAPEESSKSLSRGVLASKEISLEEMAELDETNYPVKLDESTLSETSRQANGTHTVDSSDELGDNDKISPKETAELDETRCRIKLNDEEHLPKEGRIFSPTSFDHKDTTGKMPKTDETLEASPPVGEVDETSLPTCQEKTEEQAEILESPPDALSDTQHKDKVGSNELNEPKVSEVPQIGEGQNDIDYRPSTSEKLDAPNEMNRPVKSDGNGDVKIISKLPLSPSRSEERIEDTSFNEDIIVSSPVSRKKETVDEEISSTDGIQKTENSLTPEEDSDDIPKAAKFQLMDLLETEYMRDDKVDPQVEVGEDGTTEKNNSDPQHMCPQDGLEQVQTENFDVLEQGSEEDPNPGVDED